MSGARVCAWHKCGKSLAGRRQQTRFCDQRCRQRDYRWRVRQAAKAAGLPSNLSLESVQTASPTRNRSGDAPTRRTARKRAPRPGLSVYFPDLATAELAERLLTESAEARALLGRDGENIGAPVEAVRAALERRRRHAMRGWSS